MSKHAFRSLLVLGLLGMVLFSISCEVINEDNEANRDLTEVTEEEVWELPSPELEEGKKVEDALHHRVSRRNFTGDVLLQEHAAQILWASTGTGVDGVAGATRTAPSAGATDPLEIYLLAGNVENLAEGIYRYDYTSHDLTMIMEGDHREKLASAALNQNFIAEAPASIVLAADYGRTTATYGERGRRYVHMEVGHAAQNIYLQAESLQLGTVAIGAFEDEDVQDILNTDHDPLMIMPVGEADS